MKVLAAIVVPPHLSMSGGARAAEQLSAALAGTCDMAVASMMSAKLAGASTGKVRRMDVRCSLPAVLPWSWLPNKFSTLFYRSNIPHMIASGTYDLVHIHNPMPALEMERVARAAQAKGVPYVVSTHGFNEVWNGNRVYGFDVAKRLMWKTLVQDPVARVVRNAAGIFALSPADFPIIRGMGFTGDEMTVVANGVDIPAPADAAADAAILARLGIAPERTAGELTCMFLANHTPNKGLPVLLEAFTSLERPFLLIVGGEKRADVDYESYTAKCRPGQRIVITGRLADEEVGPLYRRSDLFVFPTLADTFPLVVLEAMAHGIPVLASRVGGIPHQIDETCGRLVAPGDAKALASSVAALADDPQKLKEMGAAALARVTDRFSWAFAASQALAGYERVLKYSRSKSYGFAPSSVRTV